MRFLPCDAERAYLLPPRVKVVLGKGPLRLPFYPRPELPQRLPRGRRRGDACFAGGVTHTDSYGIYSSPQPPKL